MAPPLKSMSVSFLGNSTKPPRSQNEQGSYELINWNLDVYVREGQVGIV